MVHLVRMIALALACLASNVAVAGCHLAKVTSMPLVPLGRHYAVTVRLNGVDHPMIVDTGAGVTVLAAVAADKLKLPRDPSPLAAVPVVGLGQSEAVAQPSVIVASLGLGTLVLQNHSTAVATIDNGFTPERTSIGLLGDDILSRYDVDFDFPGKMLTFYDAQDCFDTFTPWVGDYASQPIGHRHNKLTMDIMLDRERTRAIIDTGAEGSFVTRRASTLWYAPQSAFAETDAATTSPINDGSALAEETYVFHRVKIAGEEVDGETMPVVDADLAGASALLGLDFWGSHRIWLSYPTGTIFVTKSSGVKLAYPADEPKAASGMPAPAVIEGSPAQP